MFSLKRMELKWVEAESWMECSGRPGNIEDRCLLETLETEALAPAPGLALALAYTSRRDSFLHLLGF